MVACLVADDSFFTVECVLGKFRQEQFSDQVLRAHIDLELDIVRFRRVNDPRRFPEGVPEHFARGPRRFNRCVEIMDHEES
jgi:hypothetical protein